MRFYINFCLVFIVVSSFAQNAKDSILKEYQAYNNSQYEDFKKENIWYRTWNRFDVNPGFAKYAIGPAKVFPLNNWKDYNDKFALRYRNTHMEFGASWGEGIREGDSAMSSTKRFSFGYFTPINKLKTGNRFRGVKGLLVQPVAGLGISRQDGGFGAYVSPGIHLQLPFVIIGARLNAEYAFNGSFNVFPEVSIQLDALRELLDPKVVKTGTNTSTTRTATPVGGGWYNVKSTSTTTDVRIKDIGPFWGVTPRYGVSPLDWSYKGSNSLKSFGLGLTGRINFLGADITMTRGKVVTGVNPNVIALDAAVKNKFDNKKVRGVVNTTEISFEGTANIVGFVSAIIKPQNYRDMGMKTTPLNRLNFHLGITRFIPGKVSYLHADSAQMYTDDFFSTYPDVERNAINDPLQQEGDWGVTYGVSYEMGVIGIGVYNKSTKTNGSVSFVEVYYVIPISRIIKAYKK